MVFHGSFVLVCFERLTKQTDRKTALAALYDAREELRRSGILGTRVFRGYGGAGYRNVRRCIADQEKEDQRLDQLEMPWSEQQTNANKKN
jgi:hypothetical protein